MKSLFIALLALAATPALARHDVRYDDEITFVQAVSFSNPGANGFAQIMGQQQVIHVGGARPYSYNMRCSLDLAVPAGATTTVSAGHVAKIKTLIRHEIELDSGMLISCYFRPLGTNEWRDVQSTSYSAEQIQSSLPMIQFRRGPAYR